MTVRVGLWACQVHEVVEGDTALALGSGDVPVLGTPRLVAWAEQVTVAALVGELDEGVTSVGLRIELDHVRASRVGSRITVEAAVTAVDGRTVTFEVAATGDGEVVVGRGVIRRALVDRARFCASVV